jgi:hypothetical protein
MIYSIHKILHACNRNEYLKFITGYTQVNSYKF